MTRYSGWWRAWVTAIAVAICTLAGSARAAWGDEGPAERAGAQDTVVVIIPRLGPLLLVGKNAGQATHEYVEDVIRRGVFPDASPEELRAWGRDVALRAGRAPPVAALRATGRPVIGIQLNARSDLNGADDWMSRRATVATAVIQAGGVPLFLPPAPSTKQIHSGVALVDHLILMGGADVATELQRGVPRNPKFATNLEIDRAEQELVRQALDAGLGIHAICRGSQLLQVTFGGGLIQDIPTSGLTMIDHGSGQGLGKPTWHAIRFEPDSEIGKNLGKRVWVRAKHHHHQAVDPSRVAPGFRVVATARDGIPEAIEGFDGRVIGVQVHPESAGKGSALRDAFFSATLMDRARQRMAARGRPTTTLPVGSPRAMTLAIHSTVGKGTMRPAWNVWRNVPPPVPRVAPPLPGRVPVRAPLPAH